MAASRNTGIALRRPENRTSRRHRVHGMISQLAFDQCALCAGSSDLQASHIVPGFVFDWLRETSATGHFRLFKSPNRRVQDGLKPRMLCRDCEQRFSSWEKKFSEECFAPINSGGVRNVAYGSWMLKFATSISWRVLQVFAASGALSTFPDHILTKVNDALQAWARFLLGIRPHPGPHEQHMFVVDVLEGTTIANPPPNISRYLARAIDIEVTDTQDSAICYAKMGKFILFGFVEMEHPRRLKGTKLHVQRGRFGQQDIELPRNFGDFIFGRARLAAKKYSQISERQQTKIRKTYERDPGRAAQSETLRAMDHDVLIFGKSAFEATHPEIRDRTGENKEE